ncbi:WxL domain-containing protein [Enterococcus casseliflavus]|uniref:WxL domain-containing protein n=1 Tax=Enterococcus casseliflavus TaxID=37734 RepID=UPI0025439109|nr:WxL domain-containing protein [Enterococcus casseliflavus]MDK4450922.1 WxL domain-containing protein [Enterococcus casseliflavus]
MKLVRLATVTALSATIFAGGATIVSADEVREVTTEGKIQFTADETGELEVIPPIQDPEVDIETEVPKTTGPLSIVKATTMNFGSQVISNQDQTYNMVAEMANLANGPGQVPYVSFAQVQDVRGTNAGWDLQVSLSDFESTTQNNILTGAELYLMDATIRYEGSNQENAPVGHDSKLELLPNGAARSVMTANQGKGAGASSVVWGDQAALNAQVEANKVNSENKVVENNAIRLYIPGSTAKDATTYTSTLTWELTSTPGEDA